MPVLQDHEHPTLLSQLSEVPHNLNTPAFLLWLSKSNLLPQLISSSRTIDSNGINSPSENEQDQIFRKLEFTIETFRNVKYTKMSTIASILGILKDNSIISISQSQKEVTFDSYLTEIFYIYSTIKEPNRNNTAETGLPLPPINFNKTNIKSNPKIIWGMQKLTLITTTTNLTRKQNFFESGMPCFNETNIATYIFNEETCWLLIIFNQDISKAKFFVQIVPISLFSIPSAQWERIINGDAIDLKQVFAPLHCVISDEKAKRGFPLQQNGLQLGRKVFKVISFVFPHWREEIIEYGNYIESKFVAKLISSHHKIILLWHHSLRWHCKG